MNSPNERSETYSLVILIFMIVIVGEIFKNYADYKRFITFNL